MDAEDFLPRRVPDDPVGLLMKQDLDPLSVSELTARIDALKSEIERTENKLKQSVNHKASAEALFRK